MRSRDDHEIVMIAMRSNEIMRAPGTPSNCLQHIPTLFNSSTFKKCGLPPSERKRPKPPEGSRDRRCFVCEIDVCDSITPKIFQQNHGTNYLHESFNASSLLAEMTTCCSCNCNTQDTNPFLLGNSGFAKDKNDSVATAYRQNGGNHSDFFLRTETSRSLKA